MLVAAAMVLTIMDLGVGQLHVFLEEVGDDEMMVKTKTIVMFGVMVLSAMIF